MLGVSLGKSEVVHELKLVIASETGGDQIEYSKPLDCITISELPEMTLEISSK